MMARSATTITKWLEMKVSVRIWAKPMMKEATMVPSPASQAAYDADRHREYEHIVSLLDHDVAERQEEHRREAREAGPQGHGDERRHIGVDAQHHGRPLILGNAAERQADPVVPGEEEEQNKDEYARTHDHEPLVVDDHARYLG